MKAPWIMHRRSFMLHAPAHRLLALAFIPAILALAEPGQSQEAEVTLIHAGRLLTSAGEAVLERRTVFVGGGVSPRSRTASSG